MNMESVIKQAEEHVLLVNQAINDIKRNDEEQRVLFSRLVQLISITELSELLQQKPDIVNKDVDYAIQKMGQEPKNTISGNGKKAIWRKVELDLDTVRRLYNDEKKSIEYIAKEYGCCAQSVVNFMKKHDIPTRSRGRSEVNKSEVKPEPQSVEELPK